MNMRKDLLSIGTFANMTRLSIKALRLYDQLGLLHPHHVDPQSGYRFYEQSQLARARMIRMLRDMDMPLATIRQSLAVLASSPATAESLVREYLAMRERQMEQIKQQVSHFIHLIQQEKNHMSLEVNVKKIATQQVLSMTCHIKVNQLDETIRQSVSTMMDMLKEQNLEGTDAPFGIFHGAINEEEDGPIEICLPANGNLKGSDSVEVKQLQGGDAACVMMVGAETDFPAILGAYDAAADWINKNGYATAEPPREIWHSVPGDDPKMEIVWLFKS